MHVRDFATRYGWGLPLLGTLAIQISGYENPTLAIVLLVIAVVWVIVLSFLWSRRHGVGPSRQFCAVEIDVVEIPEFIEVQRRAHRLQASPSDAGASHRLVMRVRNQMRRSAEFWVQITDMDDGFTRAIPTPWLVRWEDDETATFMRIAPDQSRRAVIAEADFMDWQYRRETGTDDLEVGGVYFLSPTQRQRTILPAHHTIHEHQTLTVKQGTLKVAIGRSHKRGRLCGDLTIWFTPEVEEPFVMGLEREWTFPSDCGNAEGAAPGP